MVSRRMILGSALAAGVARFVRPGASVAARADFPFGPERVVPAVRALVEFEVYEGPFLVDDQFEVTYYYLEEHDGLLHAKGELRNRSDRPARPDVLYVHLFDEQGEEQSVGWDYGPQDEIADVVLPGATTPFWAFWLQEHPLSEGEHPLSGLGSVRFERGADPGSNAMEPPPVVYEGPAGDNLVPDEDQEVGLLRNTGDTLLDIGYKVGYYSPDGLVLWTNQPFPESVPPGRTLPVRVNGLDTIHSPENSSTLAGLGVAPDGDISYRVFVFARP